MAWTYRACTSPEGGPSPWCRAALQALQQLDPGGRNAGCYNRRRIRGSRTRWSVHACGRAVDWRPSSAVRGHELASWIAWFSGRDVQLIIYAGRQWGGKDGPAWRPYAGADDHSGHLHIESRVNVPSAPPFTTTGPA